MERLRLHPDVHLNVAYDDRTRTGSPVGDRPELFMRELFGEVSAHLRTDGFARLVEEAPALLRGIVDGPQFAAFATVDPGSGGWRVHDEVLYPDPALAPPRQLTVASPDRDSMVRVQLMAEHWPLVHEAIAALDGDGLEIADVGHADVRAFVEALVGQGLAAETSTVEAPAANDPALREPGLTFVGHNTVVVRSSTSSVIIDPLLFARKNVFPDRYQPLARRDLAPIDAIVLTHSHRDHFDAASLLRFPSSTTVIVPDIERETVLTIDLERRLRELGFTDVVRLGWGETTLVGDIEVHALPFYGEQPTDAEVLHPEIRNEGNTYLVRTPDLSTLFLADAGHDGAGSMFDVGSEVHRRFGGVDVLFVGYRGWLTYPVQLLFSSVGRYLWFVPPWLWGSRMTLMLTPDQAIDLAERFGARTVVPYADGGAPWHWAIGLGPRLDEEAEETFGFDLFPERLVEACANRAHLVDGSIAASPVRPVLLRPGDSLVDPTGAARVTRVEGHAWCFADQPLPAR